MSRQDRQKLSIFLVLIVVLGLTLVLGYRMNRPPTTAAVQSPETKPAAKPPTASDARIRLDIVENPETGGSTGEKNLFQYGQRRPAPAPQTLPPGSPSSAPPPPAIAQPVPFVPPPPPPPPPIPLKFTGFAIVNSSLTAFLSDDSTSRHYNVTAGEILMGRYRITQITDRAVEIEDLQYNRRQMLALQK
jgi:hypothetical protein